MLEKRKICGIAITGQKNEIRGESFVVRVVEGAAKLQQEPGSAGEDWLREGISAESFHHFVPSVDVEEYLCVTNGKKK